MNVVLKIPVRFLNIVSFTFKTKTLNQTLPIFFNDKSKAYLVCPTVQLSTYEHLYIKLIWSVIKNRLLKICMTVEQLPNN